MELRNWFVMSSLQDMTECGTYYASRAMLTDSNMGSNLNR